MDYLQGGERIASSLRTLECLRVLTIWKQKTCYIRAQKIVPPLARSSAQQRGIGGNEGFNFPAPANLKGVGTDNVNVRWEHTHYCHARYGSHMVSLEHTSLSIKAVYISFLQVAWFLVYIFLLSPSRASYWFSQQIKVMPRLQSDHLTTWFISIRWILRSLAVRSLRFSSQHVFVN